MTDFAKRLEYGPLSLEHFLKDRLSAIATNRIAQWTPWRDEVSRFHGRSRDRQREDWQKAQKRREGREAALVQLSPIVWLVYAKNGGLSVSVRAKVRT